MFGVTLQASGADVGGGDGVAVDWGGSENGDGRASEDFPNGHTATPARETGLFPAGQLVVLGLRTRRSPTSVHVNASSAEGPGSTLAVCRDDSLCVGTTRGG